MKSERVATEPRRIATEQLDQARFETSAGKATSAGATTPRTMVSTGRANAIGVREKDRDETGLEQKIFPLKPKKN